MLDKIKYAIYKEGFVNQDGSIVDPIRVGRYKSKESAMLMLRIKYNNGSYYVQEVKVDNGEILSTDKEPIYLD